jgi:hypothetical protein
MVAVDIFGSLAMHFFILCLSLVLTFFWQSINKKQQCVLLQLKLPPKEWKFLSVTHTLGRAFSGGSQLRCYIDGELVSSEKCRWANYSALIIYNNVQIIYFTLGPDIHTAIHIYIGYGNYLFILLHRYKILLGSLNMCLHLFRYYLMYCCNCIGTKCSMARIAL